MKVTLKTRCYVNPEIVIDCFQLFDIYLVCTSPVHSAYYNIPLKVHCDYLELV